MPRRPEIGNVQLYPDRPLRKSDRNGYVLKFYCPIQSKRIRRNCGSRDRRDAKRIQRECQERLLNGEYVASNGAITAEHVIDKPAVANTINPAIEVPTGPTWQKCYDRYLEHRRLRVRKDSLTEIVSRLGIAERILEARKRSRNEPEGVVMSEVATLETLEYLQERLLDGDECRYDQRSPNTVNTLMGAVMAFVRFCKGRGWVPDIPPLQKLESDEVMKGRPITESEFQQMLNVTPKVVGSSSAESWIFTLKVLWESGFRVGDVMNFSWNDPRCIYPIWPTQSEHFPTIVIASSQKNGRVQEIPMLPGLVDLLESIPSKDQKGWVVNPEAVEFDLKVKSDSFKPNSKQLAKAIPHYSNLAIAEACGVSEAAVRKWVTDLALSPERNIHLNERLPEHAAVQLRRDPKRSGSTTTRETERFTVERVGRIICRIGKEAGIVVQHASKRTGQREKFASAHDIRRGCAQRLINHGVSAETLKVVMRHASFSTTEKHYGAIRTAQNAAAEIVTRMKSSTQNSAFVGGLVGGHGSEAGLTPGEISALKSLLAKL